MNGPLAIATFGPIYEELVNALMRKAMYSLQENEWTADQREAFRCYRTDIADTIMYCYVSTNALSFYRSQNVLGLSKFFVPDQKCIYILWQSGSHKHFVPDKKMICIQ